MLDSLADGLSWFHWFRVMVVLWFVRLCWLPCLLWGLYNASELAWRPLSGLALEEKQLDATIRIGVGCVLFLIWFFMVRTRGPLTLNRGRRLEIR